jgi:hypothetical protein
LQSPPGVPATVAGMRSVGVLAALLPSVLLAGGAHAQDPPGARTSGVRGRVVVEPALLAATEGPLDTATVEALRTKSLVHRPSGRGMQPLMGPMPDLQVVIEGEDLRVENAAPRTLVVEGYRFAPSQVLLTRPGAIAVENRHSTPVTIMEGSRVGATIGPRETAQITLAAGEHVLTLREMPYVRGHARVLERGLALPIGDNGDLPSTSLVEGEYSVSFWLGTERLYQPTPFKHTRNGLEYIDATVSANRVVTVAIRDASLQVAVPVEPVRAPTAPPPAPEQ